MRRLHSAQTFAVLVLIAACGTASLTGGEGEDEKAAGDIPVFADGGCGACDAGPKAQEATLCEKVCGKITALCGTLPPNCLITCTEVMTEKQQNCVMRSRNCLEADICASNPDAGK